MAVINITTDYTELLYLYILHYIYTVGININIKYTKLLQVSVMPACQPSYLISRLVVPLFLQYSLLIY